MESGREPYATTTASGTLAAKQAVIALERRTRKPALKRQPSQRLKETGRMTFRRIDDATVQQNQRGTGQIGLLGNAGASSHKAFFVLAVFQYRRAATGGWVTVSIVLRSPRSRKNTFGRVGCSFVFYVQVVLVRDGVGRVTHPRHGVAKVCHTGDATMLLQCGSNDVGSGDGVGGPDDVWLEFLNQLAALANGVLLPADPAIGLRHPANVAARNGQVPRGIQCKSTAHHGAMRHFGEQIITGLLIGVRGCSQHQGLPAQRRQMLHEAQGTLNTTAARQWRKVVGDHQYAFQTGSRW